MEKIGVEAVVAGLSAFLGDMKKVDSSISSLIPGSNLLSKAFAGVGSIVEWLTGSVFRVLEYTLGSLLADAIQAVTREIRELISSTIEAGNEFQSLEIRLRNFNFNAAKESGMEYTEAMKEAVETTKEQLTWLQKLAATTPYDLTDVANIFTLARSYGFVADEAQDLTKDITDFAAGMGLGNTEIERIIVNFGQMVQQGKVTQREMNDLARGAFVPVNDVLALMQEQTGLTGQEFDDFRNSAEGVNAFMTAFSTLVETRFAGATEAMAQTWKGASDNVKDFIKSLFGLNVVKPILDVLGKNVSEFISAFTSGDRWDAVVAAATRIGDSASSIISRLLHLGDGAEGMADRFLGAVEGIATWLETNEDKIVGWVEKLRGWIEEKAIPAILTLKEKIFGTDTQPGAIHTFGNWIMNEFLPFIKQQVLPVLSDLNDMIFGGGKEVGVTLSPDKQGGQFTDDMATSISELDNTPLQNLLQIFKDLSPAVEPLIGLIGSLGEVLIIAFGGEETETFGEFVRDTLVPALIDLKTWVDENKDGLALLLKAFIAMQIIGTIIGIIASLTIKFITFLGVVGGMLVITSIIKAIVNVIQWFVFIWEWFRNTVVVIISHIISRFKGLYTDVVNTFNEMANAIKNKDWLGVGKALVSGIWTGIKNDWYRILNLAKELGNAALSAFNTVFKIKSPSGKMFDIGENIVLGLAKGISESTKMAVGAMDQMAKMTITPMAQISSSSAPSQASISNVTNNYFTQTVNTSAPSEPIIQDFQMMQSLAGG